MEIFFSNRYGRAFTLNLIYKKAVFLSTYDEVRKIFAKQANMRPIEAVNKWREFKFGVIFNNGDTWKNQRRLMMEALRKTIHSSQIESSIGKVWRNIKKSIEVSEDKTVDPERYFNTFLLDIYIKMMSNDARPSDK